jgi:hypothetical protein
MEKEIMNWYKRAIIIDKNLAYDPNNPIFSICAFCHRYRAVDEKGNEKWKSMKELDIAEKYQLFEKHNLSHGYCPYCMHILNYLGHKFDPEDIDKIKEHSLAMEPEHMQDFSYLEQAYQ